MKVECLRIWGVLAVLQLAWSLASPAHATAAAFAATKAKHEAETQGYAFELSHNDIASRMERNIFFTCSGCLSKPSSAKVR
jgi:hypothetical protein